MANGKISSHSKCRRPAHSMRVVSHAHTVPMMPLPTATSKTKESESASSAGRVVARICAHAPPSAMNRFSITAMTGATNSSATLTAKTPNPGLGSIFFGVAEAGNGKIVTRIILICEVRFLYLECVFAADERRYTQIRSKTGVNAISSLSRGMRFLTKSRSK